MPVLKSTTPESVFSKYGSVSNIEFSTAILPVCFNSDNIASLPALFETFLVFFVNSAKSATSSPAFTSLPSFWASRACAWTSSSSAFKIIISLSAYLRIISLVSFTQVLPVQNIKHSSVVLYLNMSPK